MEMDKQLILFRGLPGSGKSSLAHALSPVVMSADDYFEDFVDGQLVYNFDPSKLREAHEWCQKHIGLHMELGKPVVAVANTFTQEWEMEVYFAMAKKWGYRVSTVIVENRHGGTNIHGVPADKIDIMKERFDIKL
jgi:predicted kinase